jgi:hypothetical protein
MWAQLMKFRLADGVTEEKMAETRRRWEDEVGRGTDSGWKRIVVFRDQHDPAMIYQLVYFESEEKARANERNPKHLAMLEQLNALMGGEPEFVDLIPIEESQR